MTGSPGQIGSSSIVPSGMTSPSIALALVMASTEARSPFATDQTSSSPTVLRRMTAGLRCSCGGSSPLSIRSETIWRR